MNSKTPSNPLELGRGEESSAKANLVLPPTRFKQIIQNLHESNPYIPYAASAGIDITELRHVIALFRSIVFHGYFDAMPLEELIAELGDRLSRQIIRAKSLFHREYGYNLRAFGQETAASFLLQLPELRRQLGTDVKAIFDGDPAAGSLEEVILCYPALIAMTHYRFAHALLQAGIPFLPRIITELAHSATGIDIHPGAEIGDYFSIDHGTGLVIGETCIIGKHVRLYQGVTLGAKSFKFDDNGQIIRQARHPILEDHVVVYSNSSILGRIRIGHDSVIGGNVWQTTDLPPYSKVTQRQASVSNYR